MTRTWFDGYEEVVDGIRSAYGSWYSMGDDGYRDWERAEGQVFVRPMVSIHDDHEDAWGCSFCSPEAPPDNSSVAMVWSPKDPVVRFTSQGLVSTLPENTPAFPECLS